MIVENVDMVSVEIVIIDLQIMQLAKGAVLEADQQNVPRHQAGKVF